MCLVPVIVLVLMLPVNMATNIIGAFIFLATAITDILDGRIARKNDVKIKTPLFYRGEFSILMVLRRGHAHLLLKKSAKIRHIEKPRLKGGFAYRVQAGRQQFLHAF